MLFQSELRLRRGWLAASPLGLSSHPLSCEPGGVMGISYQEGSLEIMHKCFIHNISR